MWTLYFIFHAYIDACIDTHAQMSVYGHERRRKYPKNKKGEEKTRERLMQYTYVRREYRELLGEKAEAVGTGDRDTEKWCVPRGRIKTNCVKCHNETHCFICYLKKPKGQREKRKRMRKKKRKRRKRGREGRKKRREGKRERWREVGRQAFGKLMRHLGSLTNK